MVTEPKFYLFVRVNHHPVIISTLEKALVDFHPRLQNLFKAVEDHLASYFVCF